MHILITAPYHEEARKTLQETIGPVVYRPWKTQGRAYNEDELLALIKASEAGALITEHDKVSAVVIEAMPPLAFIGVCRGTPSNVDLQAASRQGIPVFFTPARNAQAVAEMFLANVITFLRHTLAACQWLEDEKWASGAHDSYLQFKGHELAGKTIGMVGFGAIGRRIAAMVRALPCPVLYYDPYVSQADAPAQQVSLEDVFRESDIVSMHLPATPQTEKMIDARLLSMMKRDAVFVNTSRAMVVDRAALLEALEQRKIRGAILDVFDREPPDALDYRIIHMPQVLATPHIAGATFEVEDHHADIMNANLTNWFAGRRDEVHLANKAELAMER